MSCCCVCCCSSPSSCCCCCLRLLLAASGCPSSSSSSSSAAAAAAAAAAACSSPASLAAAAFCCRSCCFRFFFSLFPRLLCPAYRHCFRRICPDRLAAAAAAAEVAEQLPACLAGELEHLNLAAAPVSLFFCSSLPFWLAARAAAAAPAVAAAAVALYHHQLMGLLQQDQIRVLSASCFQFLQTLTRKQG